MSPNFHAIVTVSFTLALSIMACDVGPDASDDEPSRDDDEHADTEAAEDGGDDGTAPGPARAPSDVCGGACNDLGTEAGIAQCHSCRCKAAFDDWLPPAEVLQCRNAEPIVTYDAAVDDEGLTLRPAPPAATKCTNPSLLTGSCRQGSRLGHLVEGDVSVYWICRDPYLDYDGSVLFEDMAVIGHNARTGATCFWDDVNDVMHEDDAPPLDYATATKQERAAFVERFAYIDGSSCVTCHDHDPFVYTPYLRSTTWDSIAGDKGPYHRVGLGPDPLPTGTSHLVSPQADPCTSCHRLGSEDTCTFFAPNSLGGAKTQSHAEEVHAAAEPGSAAWPLAYWMPASEAPSFDAWEDLYGAARDHVLQCCEAPGESVGDCEWAPIPAVARE